MNKFQDDLLTWMTAVGTGSWQRFRSAIDELACNQETEQKSENLFKGSFPFHHKTRLRLARLGHAEFSMSEKKWRVTPPALVSLPNDNSHSAFLCGARPESLVSALQDHSFCEDITIDEQLGPSRVLITAKSKSNLAKIANDIGCSFLDDSPRELLASIPPIDNFQYRDEVELPFGEEWKVEEFLADELTWQERTPSDARSTENGLFRFMVHHQPKYYMIMNGVPYLVPNQIGKFALLRKRKRRVFKYSFEQKLFSVPPICIPPYLIDRALTLCSGLLPGFDKGRLVYTNVPHDLAVSAGMLLRQSV